MSLSSHSKSGWCLLDMMAAKLGVTWTSSLRPVGP